MNLEKRYKTADGIECSILQLVKIEPEWAANRIQCGENLQSIIDSQAAKIEELEAALRKCVDIAQHAGRSSASNDLSDIIDVGINALERHERREG